MKNRKQKTKNRKQRTENRKQKTENTEQRTIKEMPDVSQMDVSYTG